MEGENTVFKSTRLSKSARKHRSMVVICKPCSPELINAPFPSLPFLLNSVPYGNFRRSTFNPATCQHPILSHLPLNPLTPTPFLSPSQPSPFALHYKSHSVYRTKLCALLIKSPARTSPVRLGAPPAEPLQRHTQRGEKTSRLPFAAGKKRESKLVPDKRMRRRGKRE